MKDDILVGDTPKAQNRRKRQKDLTAKGRLWKHSMLGDLYGLVDQAQIERYFVTTLVRNPWDRAVSYYHWLKAQSFDHTAVHLAKTHSFTGFINHDSTQRSLAGAPYGRYVTDATGAERCSQFLRLEHLEEDLESFETHLGFKLGEVPVANASDRRAAYQPYYSKSDAALISACCAEDIKRFGYRFD